MALFSMGESYFIIDKDLDEVDHLWIIASSPDADHRQLVLVPMSSFEDYKECICRIDEGEHPQADHDSVIEYRHAKVRSSEWLHEKVKKHEARDTLVIRLFNLTSGPVEEVVMLASAIRGAWRIDLLEERQREMVVDGTTVPVTLEPHEIATLEIDFADLTP